MEKKSVLNYCNRLIPALIFAMFALSFQSCYTWKCKREHKSHIPDTGAAGSKSSQKIYKPYNPCNMCISPECTQNGCINQFCQRAIRDCHSVTAQQFIQKIQNFTGGAIPEPKVYQAWIIQGLLGNSDECEEQPIIQLCANHNDITTNNDIIIGLHPLTHAYCDQENKKAALTPDQKKAKAKYSRAMFSGVMQLEPDEFHFYKAKSHQKNPDDCDAEPTLKKDIVFLAVKDDGTILFYGDVSDLFP